MQFTCGDGGRRHRPAAMGSAVLALAVAQAVHAVEPASPPASGVLEEIVVTARQRSEDVQRVPDSVTAFGAEAIEAARIRSVPDALLLVPSVAFVDSQDAGLATISVRGIGQVRNGEPPVAIVVDGVQLSSPDQVKQALFDVQSIEVLKGPQGALYGRNAIGGAIVVTTRDPGEEFGGRVRVGVANGGFRELEGVVSGPISDAVSYRVSGTYSDFDGVIDNATLGRKVDFAKNKTARARLLWKATERLQADLTLGWSDVDGGASWYIPLPDGQPNDTSVPVQADVLGTSSRTLKTGSLKLDYLTDAGTFSSVTGFIDTDVSLFEDLDWFPQPFLSALQDRYGESWSQEFRYTSPSDRSTRWVAGAFYQNSDQKIDTTVGIGPTPYTFVPVARPTNESDATAVFAQVNHDLTTALEFTLALRYDRDQRKQTDRFSGQQVGDTTFDEWQPKVSLAYKFENAMLYATAARGFRSGGFNPPAGGFAPIYDAETTTSFEIGAKSTWGGGRVQLNGAAFRTDFDDQQIFVLNGPNQGVVNAKKTRIQGVEGELRALVTADFELNVGLSFLDSEIRDFDGTARFRGNQVPLAYGFSSTVSGQYGADVFGGRLTLRVDYTRRQDNYWHVDNQDGQDPTTLVNASIAYDRGPLQVQLWSRNLFDRKYTEEFFANEFLGLFSDIRYPGSPRRYGLTLSYSF